MDVDGSGAVMSPWGNDVTPAFVCSHPNVLLLTGGWAIRLHMPHAQVITVT